MPTVIAALDTEQYVRINASYGGFVLQAHRDSVRIVLSESQPVVGNTAFHLLGGDDDPLILESVDTNIWALAQTDRSSLIISDTVDPDTRQPDINGDTYSFTESQELSPGASIAFNVIMFSDSYLQNIVTADGVVIRIRDEFVTGDASTIVLANNLNMGSSNTTPAQAQLYLNPVFSGSIIEMGVGLLNSRCVLDTSVPFSVSFTNTSDSTITVPIFISFSEYGSRISLLPLEASTLLASNTEMSDYG